MSDQPHRPAGFPQMPSHPTPEPLVEDQDGAPYPAEIQEILREAIHHAVAEATEELLDELESVINQACQTSWDADAQVAQLDSMALSSYADGMRLLAKYGRVTITTEVGRRVIGTMP